MNDISRRTVTKGALWTVPAVVAVSATPAFAASPVTPTDPPVDPPPVFNLDFVMNAPDNHPTVTTSAPGSTRTANSAYVRLGITNVGTTEVPAGQQIRVQFTVTNTPTGTVRYDWHRPVPSGTYTPDTPQANLTGSGTITRTFTLTVPLAPGQSVSLAPGLFQTTGTPTAAMTATILPTAGQTVQGNTVFQIDNILQPVANWNVTQV